MGHTVPPEEPELFGVDCACFDAGKSPKYFTLVVRDVISCGEYPDCNGIIKLSQEQPVLFPCIWSVMIGDITYVINLNPGGATTIARIRVGPQVGYFNFEGAPNCQKTGTDKPNYYTDCEDYSGGAGRNGTVNWFPHWDPGGCP